MMAKILITAYLATGFLIGIVGETTHLNECPESWYEKLQGMDMAGFVLTWPIYTIAVTVAHHPDGPRKCQ